MIETSNWGEVQALEPRYASWAIQLEQEAAIHPSAYRRQVIAAGVLGYLVLGGVLMLPCLVMAAILVLVVALCVPLSDELALFAFISMTAAMLYPTLRLRRTPLDGVVLEPSQAPTLFATIERLSNALGAPPLDRVLIRSGMQAGLLQQVRWGGLKISNELSLGLPVFYGLGANEMEAIIAHELAHAAGAHNRSLSFVNDVRGRWAKVGARYPAGVIASILRRFFVWYGPWFVAFSQVLMRQQEFAADQAAAKVLGSAEVATALRRFVIKSICFDQHLLYRLEQAQRRGLATSTAWRRAFADLSNNFADDADLLGPTLSIDIDFTEEHPTLARRLAALGGDGELPNLIGQLPGTALLGTAVDPLVRILSTANQLSAERISP